MLVIPTTATPFSLAISIALSMPSLATWWPTPLSPSRMAVDGPVFSNLNSGLLVMPPLAMRSA